MQKIERAILSTSDKTGIVELATTLRMAGVELYSTGGTLRALRDAAVEVQSIEEYIDFPEILGGRVKTLHPRIHGGILARRECEGSGIFRV